MNLNTKVVGVEAKRWEFVNRSKVVDFTYIVTFENGEKMELGLEADNAQHEWGVSVGTTALCGRVWFAPYPGERFGLFFPAVSRAEATAFFRSWVAELIGMALPEVEYAL